MFNDHQVITCYLLCYIGYLNFDEYIVHKMKDITNAKTCSCDHIDIMLYYQNNVIQSMYIYIYIYQNIYIVITLLQKDIN